MKKVILVLGILTSVSTMAGEGGWTTRVRCNEGTMIVETQDYYPHDVQIVIRNQGVINYFAEAADQFRYYKMHNRAEWIERGNLDVGDYENIDFTARFEAGGHDAQTYTSFKISRQGNGMHVNLYRIDTWGEGGFYDETVGMWRYFTPRRAETFLRHWYFENCNFL